MARNARTAGPEIADLPKRFDALVVLDIDEVVLEFIDPFTRLLEENGARLHPESFKLTGNVRSATTGTALTAVELEKMTQRLYADQLRRQSPVAGVDAALRRVRERADIVFLTAMTPTHYQTRRALLDASDLPYPMVATERKKGAVVAELCRRWSGPVVFVDDLPPNLKSVRRSAPQVHLVHLMANTAFRPHLPSLPHGTRPARDWIHAEDLIRGILESAE